LVFLENKPSKCAHFSAPKNHLPPDRIYHAFHHDFTSKSPRKNTRFSKTTLKNPSKTTEIPPHQAANFFPVIAFF